MYVHDLLSYMYTQFKKKYSPPSPVFAYSLGVHTSYQNETRYQRTVYSFGKIVKDCNHAMKIKRNKGLLPDSFVPLSLVKTKTYPDF